MFKNLVNEATLHFSLRTEGPVLVNEGTGSKINPTLPDMSFVRCKRNGEDTVYLPGSSIKGVFRTRYEQLMRAMDTPVCELFTKGNSCSECISFEERELRELFDGSVRYNKSCAACRFFGSLSLAGRVNFSDAYPTQNTKLEMGMRHGVGISRITGAAHPGALFDIETLEKGRFDFAIKMTNFGLYQLRLLIWIIQDIDDGLVTFGMGGSRGNGQMRIHEADKMLLTYRFYGATLGVNRLRGYNENDIGSAVPYNSSVFGQKVELTGMSDILKAIGIDDTNALRKAMLYESWACSILTTIVNRR